ncbi:conjugative transposon protein TraM, partial [Arachidicoccus sp.]|uniref:conjugative transposon protein TraM n=1 Tax=Arachidicoccus sp. TaxID=1872624 RepID=UPI003D233778
SYENELPYPSIPPMNATQLQRLENLNQLSSQSDQPDAETLKLNSMLDKVLDIQHPQRWKDKQNPKENSNDSIKLLKAQPFGMAVPIGSVGHPAISSLPGYTASDSTTVTTGFYGLSNVPVADTLLNNMQAVVYRDQEIVTGATVQLMLTNDILVNHILIPKNSFVFGRATLQGERLEITIPSIRYRDKILPVRLSVYDLDGLKGIYIPGTINRDGSKQGADRAIQSIGLSSLNPSVSAEAAAAGIETAKSLLSKKVKLVRVELKAGYQVLLFDENNE